MAISSLSHSLFPGASLQLINITFVLLGFSLYGDDNGDGDNHDYDDDDES